MSRDNRHNGKGTHCRTGPSEARILTAVAPPVSRQKSLYPSQGAVLMFGNNQLAYGVVGPEALDSRFFVIEHSDRLLRKLIA